MRVLGCCRASSFGQRLRHNSCPCQQDLIFANVVPQVPSARPEPRCDSSVAHRSRSPSSPWPYRSQGGQPCPPKRLLKPPSTPKHMSSPDPRHSPPATPPPPQCNGPPSSR